MDTPSSPYLSTSSSSCGQSNTPPTSSAPLQQRETQLADEATPSRVLFPIILSSASSERTSPFSRQPYSSSNHYPAHNARQRRLWLSSLIGLLSVAVLLAILCAPYDRNSPRMMHHPLTALRRAPSQSKDTIHYLTFGSSSTWGEGLEEPQQQAYPYLLSDTVHNAAARVGGLSLSAICTQSIVDGNGNQYTNNGIIYDVIVIEFQHSDAESVIHLAMRLRQRFPVAMLVFVRVWTPASDIVYKAEDNASQIGLMEWWKYQTKQQSTDHRYPPVSKDAPHPAILGSFDFQSAILNSDSRKWSFIDRSEQAEMIEKAIQDVDGHFVSLPPLPTATTVVASRCPGPVAGNARCDRTTASGTRSCTADSGIATRVGCYPLWARLGGPACGSTSSVNVGAFFVGRDGALASSSLPESPPTNTVKFIAMGRFGYVR